MLRCQRLRATVAERDSDDLDLELNPGSETGFKHVIKVKGKYQARIYDEKEKRQRSLPGTFDTAEEAAKYRAVFKKRGFVLAAAKPRQRRGSKGAPPCTVEHLRLARLPTHGLLVRVARAVIKENSTVSTDVALGRPPVVQEALDSANVSPHTAMTVGMGGAGHMGMPVVATGEKVLVQGEPVSPPTLCVHSVSFGPA